MTHVLNMSKKAMTSAVVLATIAWSIGLSALIAPMTAKAAVSSGTLVKASMPAVYYVGSDMKRYVFPNEKTFKTWYSDFSGVMTITDAELASLAIGGNVTYKPGTRMVKITTDPKVYVVDAHGVLRAVASEAAAVSLYGSNWNQQIDDLADAFFTNYTVGSSVSSTSDFNRSAVSGAATSINADKNLSTTSVSGSLSAMLSSSQPAGGTLPKGANAVSVVKVDVKNSSSSAMTVDSVTVHRSGSGATSDISNVYVYEGSNRLTTGRTINSTSHDASFSGLNLTVGAGETKTLWVGVDFATGAASANVHSFSVSGLSSGTSGAAGLPLSGPSFTISGATSGTVTIAKSGTIPNPKAGQMSAKVAEFQIAAGTSEDIQLSKVAIFSAGSVSREKLSNFVLKQAGLTLATVSAISSKDLVSFALSSPMLIEKGNTKTFEVYADIAGSARAADTVRFYLDQTTDLLAIGSTFGYGVSVTSTNYDNSANDGTDGSWSSIDAGQITLTFNGPSAKDIATNGKDVELFNFTMASAANVEVRSTAVKLDSTGANLLIGSAKVTDIKIVDTATGATVAGPKDATAAATTETFTYTETYNLSAGQSRTFKVTADIANDATFTALKATLNAFGGSSIRNLDTSTYLSTSDIVPSSAMAGNTHQVKTPSLTIGVSSTPTSQTYIQGVQGAQVAGITLKAGDAGDVKVNALAFQGQIDTNDASATCSVSPDGTYANGRENAACSSVADVVSTTKLWSGATQLGSTKSPSTNATAGQGGLVTFDNLNLTVPKGQTITLVVSANFASSISNLNDAINFDLANSGVTATDADGNSITATGGTVNGVNMTIASAGTVTVALAPDDTESEAGMLVGGASNAVLAKYKFTATNEELKLSKARFVVSAPTAVTAVSLYDGATLIGGPSSVDGSGNADFSNMNFVIPKDGSKSLTVKGNLNSVGSSGAASGVLATVTLDNFSSTFFEVRGTSAGSSTLLTTAGAADTVGREKVLRRTKPTISLVALPQSTLSTGEQVAMRFTVSADAAGDVAMRKLVIESQVTAAPSVAVTANSSVRRVGDANNLAGTSSVAGAACAAATAGTCTLSISFANDEVIAAGTSRTYDVRVTIGGTLVTGDSLSSKVLGEAAVVVETDDVTGTAPALGINGTARNFIWSDMSGAPHIDSVDVANDGGADISSTDWTNGSYVKVLPTDTQTMTK